MTLRDGNLKGLLRQLLLAFGVTSGLLCFDLVPCRGAGVGLPAGVRRDSQALKLRRMPAARLLEQGMRPTEVVPQVSSLADVQTVRC
jgi:hypothetical protein